MLINKKHSQNVKVVLFSLCGLFKVGQIYYLKLFLFAFVNAEVQSRFSEVSKVQNSEAQQLSEVLHM